MINWIRSTQGLYTLNYALAKSRLHYTLDPVSLSLEIELHRICSTGYLPLESDRPISFVHNFERLSTGRQQHRSFAEENTRSERIC